MIELGDKSVCEIGSACLTLRRDLVITPQISCDQAYYMVEDPLTLRFFRLGLAEYTFVSLFDGKTTIKSAFRQLSMAMPDHHLTEAEAAGLCRWLVEMDLVYSSASSNREQPGGKTRNSKARWNPLVFRVPFGSPDRCFAAVEKTFGWLYSPVATVCALALMAFSSYLVISKWEQFEVSTRGVFSPDNWIWLVISWIVLKIAHETSHGVVCKRYGGRVRETGVLFILFAPLAYVDVTSSWRFRSRWQRIHVAAAGVYAELLIASVAAIVWNQTGSGWLNNLCSNIVLMSSVTAILFNANPLMKFDGYYILSDLMAMPNLYVNGQTYLRYWARRYLLGLPVAIPDWPKYRGMMIRFYGVTSYFWRIFICVCLTVTAATLFHGAGIALAFLAVVILLGMPTLRFLKFLLFDKSIGPRNRRRCGLLVGAATAMVMMLFFAIPWPGVSMAPAVVEYSPATVVRAGTAGFVDEIHVVSGQFVQAGQLLLVLENRELKREAEDLKLRIRQSEIRARKHEQQRKLALRQAELEMCAGLQAQLQEKRKQVALLTIRAPSAGRIVRRRLAEIRGTYLEVGDEISTIGDESRKEMRLSVAQDELHDFSMSLGRTVSIDIPGRSILKGCLKKLVPRATLIPIHPAMTANNGGPLAIQPTKAEEHSARASNTDSMELLSPRFTGIIPLGKQDGLALHAGQVGNVTYRPFRETVGQRLYRFASSWIRVRVFN